MPSCRAGLAAITRALALAAVLLASPAPPGHAQGSGQGPASPTSDPILRIDTAMHQSMIRRLVVDATGQRLVTAGDDKSVRMWQLGASKAGATQTARLVQTLRVPIDSGHEGQLFALALSPDGQRIATGGWTCWDWERAGCVYVFDVESGAILRRLRGLPDAVSALAWSPDGRHLAIGLQGRAGIRVLRTDTFEEVAADREFADKVMELAYDARGSLAAVALDGRIRVYRPDHRLHGRVGVQGGRQPATVRFTPNGRRLAVGFLDAPAVTLIDPSSLAVLGLRRIDDRQQRNLSNVAWSRDGATLYAAGERSTEGPNTIYRWPDQGLGPVAGMAVPARRVSDLQALPAHAVAYSAEDPRFGIVNAQGELTLDRPSEISDFAEPGFTVRASVDGATVGFTGPDGRERVFSAGAEGLGNLTPPPPATPALLSAAITQSPGWQIDRAADRLAIRVNGRPVPLDDYETVHVQAFNAAGDALFLGTEWALRRVDRSGTPTWRVKLAAIVRGVVVSGDGLWVIAALSDGTIRWYRARDGHETLSYFAHANAEDWIAWTPAGYYMSSLHGDQYVGWHVNRGADRAPDFHRAVQFERVLYRPDIVTTALRTAAQPNLRQATGAAAERFDAARLAQIGPPRLTLRVLGVDLSADGSARARIRISGERGARALRELTVYVNEIPVTHARDRALGWTESSRVERELDIPLGAAGNDIRVESYTEVSMGVAERFVAVDPAVQAAGTVRPATGDLYVLAIGNNTFPQLPPAANLEFAARDAEALASALATQGRGTFRAVHVEVLADDRSRKANRQNVLDALAFTRRARPEDTVVVFLASHGVSDRAGNYWFVPRDATEADLKAIETSTPQTVRNYDSLISWSVFFDALRQTVGRRLLIVDTCQAKGIEGRFESFALLKRSAASRFSMMVAAQSDEESQEYPPGRHGLFTYALLQALSPSAGAASADTNGDGQISMAELFAVAAPVVARLHDRALGSQTPALIAPPSLAGAPLATARR